MRQDLLNCAPEKNIFLRFIFKVIRKAMLPMIRKQNEINQELFDRLEKQDRELERLKAIQEEYSVRLTENAEKLLQLNGMSVNANERIETAEKSVRWLAERQPENAGRISAAEEKLLQLNGLSLDLNERLARAEGSIRQQAEKHLQLNGLSHDLNERLERAEDSVRALRDKMNYYHDEDYLSTMDYFQFENRFRGPREQIKEAQKCYLKYFEGRQNVYDIGCGRGEFTELLTEADIGVTGIDMNQAFVDFCQKRDLNVKYGDGLQALRELEKKADGIFISQVAEHLSPSKLLELCRICYSRMEEGSYLIMETPNPRSLSTFANAFYIDPSHVKPVHPELLRYFIEISGFKDIEIVHTDFSRCGKEIPHIIGIENEDEVNKSVDILNQLLFSSMDYAVIAKR